MLKNIPRSNLRRSVRSPVLRPARLRFLAGLVLAVIAGVAGVTGYAADAPASPAPQPQLRQLSWSVPGLAQPAEILVDRWGVPHIYAGSQYDAFFVQGFNAARDRLWQIDLWRRRGLGLLAEAFGPDYVEQDRAARLFLFRGSMRDEWLAYGSDAKRIAEQFVAGINAYIALTRQQPELLPVEFSALKYSPSMWRAEDVVRIRSNGLWRNVTSEVTRAQVACRYGLPADGVRMLLRPNWTPRIPQGLDPCIVNDDVLRVYRLATAEVRFSAGKLIAESRPDEIRTGIGSNNWVVAGSRTATGRPLLANDPHRSHSVPSLRYITHLSAPGMDIIGAGEPALPGVSIGHNERIAFGLTIFGLDQEDLYVYRTRDDDHDQYAYSSSADSQTPGSNATFESVRAIEELVPVRGEAARKVVLRFTRHGPIVHEDQAHHLFAVRAAWLAPGMSPYFGSVEYMRANNWDQFLAALNRWGAPAENQVYADVDGNIGYRPAGYFPRRSNFDGLLPVPGDGRFEWQDAFDMDALPFQFNPARGWVATANSMQLPADYPIGEQRVGFEWTAPWRLQRLEEVLAGNPRVSVADALALQRDYSSMPARRLSTRLKALVGRTSDERAALQMLSNWDGTLARDSAAAVLFNVWWQRHLLPGFVQQALPAGADTLVTQPDSEYLVNALTTQKLTPAHRELLLATLGAAWRATGTLLGTAPEQWRWGSLHQMRFKHPLLDRAGDLALGPELQALMTMPPQPRGGNADTPNSTSYNEADFDVRSGASWRMVLDVGNWDAARMTNAPGQSGDPRSPFYANLLQGWADEDSFPLLYSRAAIEHATVLRIALTPQQSNPAATSATRPGPSSAVNQPAPR